MGIKFTASNQQMTSACPYGFAKIYPKLNRLKLVKSNLVGLLITVSILKVIINLLDFRENQDNIFISDESFLVKI